MIFHKKETEKSELVARPAKQNFKKGREKQLKNGPKNQGFL